MKRCPVKHIPAGTNKRVQCTLLHDHKQRNIERHSFVYRLYGKEIVRCMVKNVVGYDDLELSIEKECKLRQKKSELLEIVKNCKVYPEGKSYNSSIKIASAVIILSSKKHDWKPIINSKRFSCIDNISDKNSLSSTCVDSKLGTVFGLDCMDKRIVIIPQHYVTQMTFVDFYLFIKSKIDDKAELTTFQKYASSQNEVDGG